MTPEQAMGEREITRADRHLRAGRVTYEMLAGEPPFTGPTAQAIVAKVLTETPAAGRGAAQDGADGRREAVMTALEKLPADRYASAKASAPRWPRRLTTRRRMPQCPSGRGPPAWPA